MHIKKNIKLGTCVPTFALLFLLSSVHNANADVFIPFEQTIADQYNMPSSSAQEVEEVTEPVAVVSFEQTIADQYNMPSSSAQEVEEVTEPVAVVSFEQTIEDQYNSPYAVTEIVEEDASEEAFDYSMYDPNEEENRKSFEFHQKLDKNL